MAPPPLLAASFLVIMMSKLGRFSPSSAATAAAFSPRSSAPGPRPRRRGPPGPPAQQEWRRFADAFFFFFFFFSPARGTAARRLLSVSGEGGANADTASAPAPAASASASAPSSSSSSSSSSHTESVEATASASSAARVIMRNALFRVRDVNRKPPPTVAVLDFVVDHQVLGKVTQSNAERLLECGNGVFEVAARRKRGLDDDDKVGNGSNGEDHLTLSAGAGSTFEDRTEAVAAVTHRLRREGIVRGWRNELYPVSANFYQNPAFAMERAAVPILGALEYGVHINGLVAAGENYKEDHKDVRMWMARRSATKSKFPGMLDHLVAGGQPLGLSLLDNAIKECHEEAGISEALARQGLRPVSAISYETYVEASNSISRAVLFNYDLWLPSSFVPVPVDGEVDEFFLWTVPDLLESLDPDYPDPIKPNCYSVMVDFLVRHGHLAPDTPGYLDVVRELRSGECR